ncbi:hypothetical protein NGB36_27065 [Streptomyces sp. RB6PN25]|uniref:Uncharacterized protein n=1 Tax=Streptomyces humicola TaxID=2953240 RepID=A0ABT1Q2I6_9ACTN|nr:hypothetical protein [Streptomyces humicola]MCQ4084135.1 hypothetical protein [Streptomyces humicola]
MSDVVQPPVAEVRAAAEAVKAAIDRHLAAIENRTGEDDPAVYAAFDALASAAEAYDELLYDAYDEVTPFEVPAGDSLPAYGGPAEPGAISVLIRRDYAVAEPQRLIAQAARVADEVTGAGTGVGAAIGALFGEYEPDEIASRHKEFGLEEGDSTLWVQAADPAEPGEWLAAPFDQADPELTVCRFDISAVYDDEDEEGEADDDEGGGDSDADDVTGRISRES